MSMTIKQINTKISALTKSNTKFNDEVQMILCGIACHAFDDKNVDPATRLVVSNPDEKDVSKREFRFNGLDNRVLIHWIERHMPARWVEKDAAFSFNASFKNDYDAVALLGDAWWKRAVKPQNIATSLDCLEAVRVLLSRLTKEAEAGKKTLVHPEMIAQLAKLANDNDPAFKKAV